MKEKKKLFNIATYGQMLIDIILFALGVYSASNPTSSNTVIGVAFGICLSIVGIYNIIKYIFFTHLPDNYLRRLIKLYRIIIFVISQYILHIF